MQLRGTPSVLDRIIGIFFIFTKIDIFAIEHIGFIYWLGSHMMNCPLFIVISNNEVLIFMKLTTSSQYTFLTLGSLSRFHVCL